MPDGDSTLADIPRPGHRGVSRVASRIFIGLLLLACVAGAVGLLGGHTSVAVSTRNGYRVQLSYPGTARPGLDTFWELEITHPGGFKGQLTIAVTGAYFDLFETQGFYPTPSATTRDGSFVYMTFTAPSQGDTFKVMYDAYVQPYLEPNHLLGQTATVAVMNHGQAADSIHYTTWLLP
ncbi:MAG: hypothetical protein QOI06_2526 [Nocardioidaceae bacterium]|nr:hypothetical protein [Nocardioidaceae bacterium]